MLKRDSSQGGNRSLKCQEQDKRGTVEVFKIYISRRERCTKERSGQKVDKELMNDLSERGVLGESVKSETKESIKQKMRELDTREWTREMNEKSSLKIYRRWKREIEGQEEVYTNNQASEILCKTRTYNLNLKERKRSGGEDTKCDMCGADNEDLKHFLLWCPAYAEERGKITWLQQPYTQEDDDTIGKYLLENRYIEETKKEIYKFWTVREKRRREGEKKIDPDSERDCVIERLTD